MLFIRKGRTPDIVKEKVSEIIKTPDYLGICYGGEHDDKSKPYVLCCDAARKEKNLTINPWDQRQMKQ